LASGLVSSDFDVFRQASSELGYVEGRNLVIEQRYARGSREQYPELAADLVGLKVDVIVTTGSRATRAAQKATTTTPIVSFTGNPVLSGLVPSFSRPGGNLTGFATLAREANETRIELLREAVPGIVRLAVLIDRATSGRKSIKQSVEEAAQRWGIQPISVATVRRADDLDNAFASAVKEGAGGALAVTSALFMAERQRIMALAARARLPVIYGRREFIEAGGLMSYGPRTPDMYRRAAAYVAEILRGARPGDLVGRKNCITLRADTHDAARPAPADR
jgi:putative ABC transport system substrate-binding protein